MPDIEKKTISATQSPALFGVSPYVTKWMLWHHFANGLDLDEPEHSRMSWGKKMQPLVLQQAAEELRLEVTPNDDYCRRGLLGCTRDAIVVCPDRGPGALESKCVFDYSVWMSDWAGGKSPPRHVEIQLQQQMYVGDGKTPFQWGVIPVWVCGETHYFERKPIPDLWKQLESGAAEFFADVEAKREPDPFGVPIELPWLASLLPTVKGNVVDLRNEPDAEQWAEKVSLYDHLKEEASAQSKAAEKLRAEILAFAKDAEEIALPGGVKLRITTVNTAARVQNVKAYTSKRLNIFVPYDAPVSTKPKMGELLNAG